MECGTIGHQGIRPGIDLDHGIAIGGSDQINQGIRTVAERTGETAPGAGCGFRTRLFQRNIGRQQRISIPCFPVLRRIGQQQIPGPVALPVRSQTEDQPEKRLASELRAGCLTAERLILRRGRFPFALFFQNLSTGKKSPEPPGILQRQRRQQFPVKFTGFAVFAFLIQNVPAPHGDFRFPAVRKTLFIFGQTGFGQRGQPAHDQCVHQALISGFYRILILGFFGKLQVFGVKADRHRIIALGKGSVAPPQIGIIQRSLRLCLAGLLRRYRLIGRNIRRQHRQDNGRRSSKPSVQDLLPFN